MVGVRVIISHQKMWFQLKYLNLKKKASFWDQNEYISSTWKQETEVYAEL